MSQQSEFPLRDLTRRLRENLTREDAFLQESKVALARAHSALKHGNLAQLDQARIEQERLAAELRDVSTQRMDVVRVLAHAVGVPMDSPSLKDISDRLPPESARELLEIRDQLRSTVREVITLQKSNATIIQSLRSFFRGVLSGLTAPETPTRYGPTGARLTTIS
jgi:flagellar biosynthesis/type III secretory pathway chaperone